MFYKRKVALVTGGSGMVGTYIVEELLRQEARVRVAVHQRPLRVHDSRVEVIRGDLTLEGDCLAAIKGVDCVFHAAGVVGSAALTPAGAMPGIITNLLLAARVLHAAWVEKVDRVLLPISSTVYPAVDHPVKEEEAWSGPPHASYMSYGWMKRYIEKLAEFVASSSSTKIALVRPTAVYGRWDNFDPASSHVIPALIRKAVDRLDPFEVWGTGQEVRDFLHARDMARGCLLALERHPACDPVNLGSGKAVTIGEVAQTVLKAAGHHSARVVFNTSKPTTIPLRMVDISKARRILGFEPEVSLGEGLTDTVRWYMHTRHAYA